MYELIAAADSLIYSRMCAVFCILSIVRTSMFQPIQFTPEVLSLLPSTLLLSLISKSSQNLEISAILLVFRSFFAKAQLTLILTNTSIVKAL